jgi:cysteine synthase
VLLKNSLSLIGNTPLIELTRIYRGAGRLFGKAEFMQPGGSVKDRAALRIVLDAYESGELVNGQPIIEMTSGNMGAGLAVVANMYGHEFIAVMSAGNSPARARMLAALGATVVLTPQVDGAPGQVTGPDIAAAVEEAKKIAIEKCGYYVDQFNNPSCIRAHFDGTGPEIWPDLGKSLDVFIAAAGSGGTFIGTSQYLKRQHAKIFCVAVEPEGAEILAGKPLLKPKHNMQGIGYGIQLPHWDNELVDAYLSVSSAEAELFKNKLAKEEGLYVGYSAAANVCASIKFLESGVLGKAATAVTILCDTGLKY